MSSNRPALGFLEILKSIRYLSGFAVVFGLHYLALVLGDCFTGGYQAISLVWPASGTALAFILLYGYRVVLPIALSLALFQLQAAHPFFYVMGSIASHLSGVLLTSIFLRRVGFSERMERSSDFNWLILIPPLFGATAAATIDAYFYTSAKLASPAVFAQIWVTDWMGHALGVWIAAPLLLVWFARIRLPYSRNQMIEGLAALSVLAFLSYGLINAREENPNYAMASMAAPLLVWIYFSLGARGATLATIVLAASAMWAAGPGHHHLSAEAAERLRVGFWALFTPVAISNLLICSIFLRGKWRSESSAVQEARFKALIENTTDIVTVTSLDGTIQYESPSIQRMLGYSPDELIGKNAFDLIHPEDTPKALQAFFRGVQNPGVVETAEFRYRHKDRRWRILESYGVNQLLNPAVGGMVITSRDVTERRMDEDRLRGMSAATEESPVSIVITDIKGNINYVNAKFEQVTGYTRDEVRGHNPRILKSGELSAQVYKDLWNTILSGNTWRGEFHNRRKNGDLFWESAVISPLKDSNGKITHFLAIKEDVTQKKLLEAQFRQAQKMEAVGQLAGGVAHDFNNLLTIILGYCELFLQQFEKGTPMYSDMLEMRQAGERAAALTRHLLAFSRRQVFQLKTVDMNVVLKNLDKMLRRLIGENIELVMDLGEGVPWIRIDTGHIEQALVNLVVNARDAMPTGGKVTISTRLFHVDEAFLRENPEMRETGEYFCLEVADTGIGMNREIMSRVFEPFFTTKEKGKGTGLGLSMVYGIVKQSNGFIYVDSEPGKGTTFRLLFQPSREGLSADKAAADGNDMPGGTERVLVVEDEPVVRGLAVRVLQQCGYNVSEAPNGHEAWHKIRDKQIVPHLVLTDVIMPLMGGRDLGKNIQEVFPEIKILYMSGYSDERGLQRGELGNKEGFIQKPFSTHELAVKVRQMLDKDAV